MDEIKQEIHKLSEQYHELGQVRFYSETYDVIKVFGVCFVRKHYKQFSWRTGKELKRNWLEIHPESGLQYIINTQLSQPDDVFSLMESILVRREMNNPLGLANND